MQILALLETGYKLRHMLPFRYLQTVGKWTSSSRCRSKHMASTYKLDKEIKGTTYKKRMQQSSLG